MTNAQRIALAHLSDGEWRLGADLTRSAGVLGKLERSGYIRCDFSHHPKLSRLWTATPDGLSALEASQ